MQPNLMDQARGRWTDILSRFIDSHFLKNKHGPCPICGGKDRFRFDDKGGDGMFYCSSCGAGSGLHLLALHQGIDHKQAAKLVYEMLPESQFKEPEKKPDHSSRIMEMWGRRKPISEGDEVSRYLEGRGLNPVKSMFRLDGKIPAMMLKIAKGNRSVGLHLTHIQDGKKANIDVPKRTYAIEEGALNGGAIRLFDAADHLLVAEGIETAMSAGMIFGIPCWSTVNAGMMERLELPEFVRQVTICADRDKNFRGQVAAYKLAERLTKEGRKVCVQMPVNKDFNDDLMESLRDKRSNNSLTESANLSSCAL